MFEEFQEAALKEEQKKKFKIILNSVTGILFAVSVLLLMFYVD